MKLDFTKINNLCKPGAAADSRAAATGLINNDLQERQQMQRILHEYQNNTRQAELLKASIAKGLKCGTPPGELLLAAAECISLLTNDPAYCEQIRTDAELLQGLQNGEQTPAAVDMQHRLHLMKRCIENALESCCQDKKRTARG